MYLVLIAWIYVALMMAIAEATSPVGTLLGAVVTFLLYGLLPQGGVGYIMGAPSRRRAIKAKEAAERAQSIAAVGTQTTVENENSVAPNTHSEASSRSVAAVRKEP